MTQLTTFNPNQISMDAGLRIRTSQLTTLGDYKIIGQDRTLLWENAGDGTGAFTNNKYSMSVGANEWLVRNTKRHHHYFSGKSQAVELTFDNFHPETGVAKRAGYFSSSASSPYDEDYDGFWIETDDDTIYLKSSRAGTETYSKPMIDWFGYVDLGEYQNESRWENFTVVFFDFVWLGGAWLRLWVKTNHGFVLADVFHYSGTSEDVFILSPNQPLRYEIRSSGGTGSLRYICAQVSTEGSVDESGLSRYVDTGTTAISLSGIGTKFPIKAVRINPTYHDIAAVVETVDAIVTSASDLARWTLEINPTLSAPLSYTAIANSALQEASGNGTITVSASGTIIAGGSIQSASPISSKQLIDNFLAWFQTTLDETTLPIILCITPISSPLSVYGGVGVKEF